MNVLWQPYSSSTSTAGLMRDTTKHSKLQVWSVVIHVQAFNISYQQVQRVSGMNHECHNVHLHLDPFMPHAQPLRKRSL